MKQKHKEVMRQREESHQSDPEATYDIVEHTHRFAAWAASTAARVKGGRFRVETGKIILESAGLRDLIADPDALPPPEEFNLCHRAWRADVIKAAANHGFKFTHGMAAKLINVYLKAAMINTATSHHRRIAAVHPPIDRLLLRSLGRRVGPHQKFWRDMERAAWSKFDSTQYELVIAALRRELGAQPFWVGEAFWSGYQD